MITLEVGNEKAKFLVHKIALCAASDVFEAACKPEWLKESNIIELPVDDPDAIHALINWIYSDEIWFPEEPRGCTFEDPLNNALASPFGFFATLYILAEKYQIAQLRNDAVDAIIEYNKYTDLPISLVSYVYANTTEDSTIRHLLLDLVRCEFDRDQFLKFAEVICSEFIIDLAVQSFGASSDVLDKYAQDVASPDKRFCERYHTHGDDEPFCAGLKEPQFPDD